MTDNQVLHWKTKEKDSKERGNDRMIVADLFCNGGLISNNLPRVQVTSISDKYSNINKESDFFKFMQDKQERLNSLDKYVKNNIYTKYGTEATSYKNKYFSLADETGAINYHGVVFNCDEMKNALCLGDMSNMENVMVIPLSGGGRLMVNRDNIDGLAKAIGMFTPEDVKRILDAIATDAKVKNKGKEIQEKINKAYMDIIVY